MSDQESKYKESLVSQDVLDELMKEAESDTTSGESKDLDLVSPEDIARLLGDGDSGGAEPESSESSDLDQVSQDDIDALLSGEELGGGEPPENDSAGDDSLISQEDIDALLAGGSEPAPAEDAPDVSDPPVTDTSQTDLISQEDIDALLSSTPADDTPADETSGESLISQDDIDALLAGAGEDDPFDTAAPEEDALISQEDIDNLLNSSDDDTPVEAGGEDSEAEKLITQDDIDRLLSDDDLGDSGADDGGTEVSQGEIDKLLNADTTDHPEVEIESPDQVILEQGEPEQDSDGNKPFYKSKLFISIAASLLICVLIGGGTGIYMMKSGGPDPVDEPAVVQESQETLGTETTVESVAEMALDDTEMVSLEMKDFVVPAPVGMKGVSYIHMDLSLEIVDVTSNPIKGYEPFFRNIVYEVLKKALSLQNKEGIIEADLIEMIRTALDDALSEGSVGEIDFLTFKLT